jgi:DNA mismatch repair protein MutS
LLQLEQDGIAHGRQPDLFAQPVPAARQSAPVVDPLLDKLRTLDPDALTPREALDALYALKKLLDQ